MKITVAGKDRTPDLGQAVTQAAERLKAGSSIDSLAADHTALRLKQCEVNADYLGKFIDLLRIRHGTRTADFYIARGPGLRGKAAVALKTFLWKLLRYQHDRIAFQQGLVNELAINALEFQQSRIEALERKLESLEPGQPQGPAT